MTGGGDGKVSAYERATPVALMTPGATGVARSYESLVRRSTNSHASGAVRSGTSVIR
jgi:hypothetical protein